jgi:phenylalanyl-tRNA synthetase beta chain
VAAVLTGSWQEATWNQKPQPLDFFDGKGVIEALVRELCAQKLRFKALCAEDAPWLQPGRAAQVQAAGRTIGWLGEIHPTRAQAFGVEVPVVAFELDMAALVGITRPARDYRDIAPYPAVELDVAIVVDETVSAEKLVQVASSAAGKLLGDIAVFDVYIDADKIGAGKKSVALRITYRDLTRTLTLEEAEKAHAKVVKKVCGATKGTVR